MNYSSIVLFRQDLRINDNPALSAAVKQGNVLPLFVWSPDEDKVWPMGDASKWWLYYSLCSLKEELQQVGLDLIVRQGGCLLEVLKKVITESGAKSIYWNRCYEPHAISRDTYIKKNLIDAGYEVASFNGSLLFEPWTILNKQGKPFQVFTPFWKTCLLQGSVRQPLPPIVKYKIDKRSCIYSDTIDSLNLLPKTHWDEGLKQTWHPGSKGADGALKAFINHIGNYESQRDRPDKNGVSMLSPYLHFGELSPRMIWQSIKENNLENEGVECFLRQLGWREFAHHLLFHFPFTPNKPLRQNFELFKWKNDPAGLKAWQKGLTGYPFVDAGMRQLWRTGWMHNRVRMVVGSFLVKDLRISWLEGAKWFWDTLVDADLANNTLGWQWVGGCGADAAPYFRIFNPITQGEKFDPEGVYIKKWIPELAKMPIKWIHRPWEAPADVLNKAGVVLGDSYPYPIVDHAEARGKALEEFNKSIKSNFS